MVDAVLTMGRKLNMRVISEGVENEVQAKYLIDAGCLLLQGFYYGHPAAAGDIAALLHVRPEAEGITG